MPAMTEAGTSLHAIRARLRAELDIDDDVVLLNAAGVSPMCRPARAAIERAAREFARGFFALDELFAEYGRARATYARLCGATPHDVAMFHTCAAALSQVALGLSLAPGDELVLWDQEYPSNAYPWHEAARRSGAVVRVVPSEPDFSLNQERLHAAITPRTRAVAVSWVQYQTGAVTDLESLSRACRAVGAWLVVDAIQGLGLFPLDLAALGVDAVAGGTHKWLGGPLGHGFLALAPGRAAELQPLLHGAMTYGGPDDAVDPQRPAHADARRFEPGSPLMLGALGGAAAIELLLALSLPLVHAAALQLTDLLIDGLRERGARLLLPQASPLRSPIVTFVPRGPTTQVDKIAQGLRARRVACARRAGGIRLAPHAFNTEQDVARFFRALDAAA
jgi:selenocysteine lyase/cysteine desulfurase